MTGWCRRKDSVGGTPTDAVETTVLPEKSLMIWVRSMSSLERS